MVGKSDIKEIIDRQKYKKKTQKNIIPINIPTAEPKAIRCIIAISISIVIIFVTISPPLCKLSTEGNCFNITPAS